MRFPLNASRLVVPLLALLLTLLAAPVAAQTPCDGHAGRLADINTREQLKQFVHCAAAHVAAVGWEQAAVDFETSAWLRWLPVSLLPPGADGAAFFIVLGFPDLTDDNLWDWQDSDGVWITSQEMERIVLNFGERLCVLSLCEPRLRPGRAQGGLRPANGARGRSGLHRRGLVLSAGYARHLLAG